MFQLLDYHLHLSRGLWRSEFYILSLNLDKSCIIVTLININIHTYISQELNDIYTYIAQTKMNAQYPMEDLVEKHDYNRICFSYKAMHACVVRTIQDFFCV